VHGAGSDFPVQAPLDLVKDGAPVRLLAEPEDGQKYGLFEGSEHIGHS